MKFIMIFLVSASSMSLFASELTDMRKNCPELAGVYSCTDSDKSSFDLTITQSNEEGNGTQYVSYGISSQSLKLQDSYQSYEVTYVGPGSGGLRHYTTSGCGKDDEMKGSPDVLVNEQILGGRSTNVDAVSQSRNVFWKENEALYWKMEEAHFDVGTAHSKTSTCVKVP